MVKKTAMFSQYVLQIEYQPIIFLYIFMVSIQLVSETLLSALCLPSERFTTHTHAHTNTHTHTHHPTRGVHHRWITHSAKGSKLSQTSWQPDIHTHPHTSPPKHPNTHTHSNQQIAAKHNFCFATGPFLFF